MKKTLAQERMDKIIMYAAAAHGVPVDLAKAVAWQESKWNPAAKSFDAGHGKGLFQVDDRFHDFAKTPAVWDAEENADYGCKYLQDLYGKWGNWPDAIMHYNGSNDTARIYAFNVWRWSQIKPWGT